MVDDIYAVVGSANINQRSMDGRRDTEIAVGCFETGESETDLVTDGHVQGLRKVFSYGYYYSSMNRSLKLNDSSMNITHVTPSLPLEFMDRAHRGV